MAHPNKAGFSLLELMVALAISGVLMVAAHGLLQGIGDAAAGQRAASATHELQRWQAITARDLLAQVQVSPESGRVFVGSAQHLRFTSWCLRADGWSEECRVTLRVVAERGGCRLVVTEINGPTVPGTDYCRLGYVLGIDPLVITSQWGPSFTAPLAVLLVGRDTVVFGIGERG